MPGAFFGKMLYKNRIIRYNLPCNYMIWSEIPMNKQTMKRVVAIVLLGALLLGIIPLAAMV